MSSPPEGHGVVRTDPRPRADVAVSAAGLVTIRSRELFGIADRSSLRQVLVRLFAVPDVAHVAIRTRAAIGDVQLAGGRRRLSAALRKLAAGLLGQCPSVEGLDASRLHVGRIGPEAIRVFRYGRVLTTWRIVHELAGRIRIVHERLHRHSERAGAVEHELRLTHGVHDARASALTGSLLVVFDPLAIDRDEILGLAEVALSGCGRTRVPGYDHPHRDLQSANAVLAVATVGQFAFPPLLALSAGMLVCSNLDAFDTAWRQARKRQAGAPAVKTAVVALTLGTGSFFVAALALWMMEFWDRVYHRRLTLAQQRLLAQLGRRPHRVTARRDGVSCELWSGDLLPGDEITLRPGDVVSGDVRVIAGECEVEERIAPAARNGSARRRPGDWLYAGAVVVAGEVTVRLNRCGERTRAAALIRAIETATTPIPAALTDRGDVVAARSAPPTLATAALAMLAGDPANALAVLRLDYASGPGMHGPVTSLRAVATWLRRGIIACDGSVLQRLAGIEVVVIDASACTTDDPTGARALAGLVHRLRSSHGLRVGVVRNGSDAPPGADFELAGGSPEERLESLADLGSSGVRMAFVGDCRRDQEVVRMADLAISIAGSDASPDASAHIWVPQDRWMALDVLWEVVDRHRQETRGRFACTIVPNAVCVAGALLFGFTTMAAVMLTNLGTGWGFLRNLRDLRQLELEGLESPDAGHSNGGNGARPCGDAKHGHAIDRGFDREDAKPVRHGS